MRMLLLLATALAGSAAAQNMTPDAAQREALAQASRRGALLYAYDQAAWHGTDDMMAKLKDYPDKIAGYVVDGPASAPRLIFFDKTGQAAVYIATFKGTRLIDGRVLGESDDRALSLLDRRMILALGAAREAISKDSSVGPCVARPFNTVVVPPEREDGPISVYFMTPQTDSATIPFGGHFKVDVDAAGEAGPVRRFTRGCLDMPTRTDAPRGAKPEALFVSHILDPVPTEMHVFASLALRTPVMVMVPATELIWPVMGTNIGKPVPVPAER